MGIRILSTGSYLPPLTVTNDDLSGCVDTNDEWIRTRTGISERHMSNGEPTWYMGAQAARKAIAGSGINPLEIGLIICSTVSSDFFVPSCAAMIQRETGASNAAAFDLGAACSGFVYSLDTAHRFLSTDKELKYVLIVAAEQLSYITDFTDRSSCILFGDGAAAAVVERSDSFFTSWLGCDGDGMKYLYAKAPHQKHPFMKDPVVIEDGSTPGAPDGLIIQDGKEVYKFAVKALPNAVRRALEGSDRTVEDIDLFIPHQANIRIIETAAKNIGVSLEKMYVNISRNGNTSSASIPLALYDAIHDGSLQRGQTVCLVGFGAGLTQAAAVFEY
ncbi:MAG: ketoacyl-ACP synthase III [Oscillospiraceae bacterium]|nr:ketoacyl-ACP synthase III [Oscillospiraceae bacterium]